MVTTKFFRNLAYHKCEEIVGRAVEQEGKLCDGVNTVRIYMSR